MLKDLCDVLRDSMGGRQLISEESIIQLIGLYGLTRLNNAGMIKIHEFTNGSRMYSLLPVSI